MTANRRLCVLGGISGIVGTLCYVIGITMSFSPALTYAVVMAWPVLSIVFVFALNRYVALEKDTASNQLAFIFACLGFTLVASMMSVQLAVTIGMDSSITKEAGSQQELLTTVKHSMRWVDMGIDVAWDVFIGTALLFLSIVLSVHTRFGFWWGIPAGLLGAGLIILNISTFPGPPGTRGLFDVGPVIGLFIIALSGRLLLLGNHLRGTSTPFADHREQH
jgi:hypothetical protein